MANKIPPVPVGSAPGSAFWNDWYEKLRNLINSGTISQLWSSLDFTASNITDIVTRNHNNLQGFQGGTAGEYYHLTSAEHTSLTSIPTLASGTYTPTLFNTTNITDSVEYTCQYLRVGNVVSVSGLVEIDPIAAGDTILGMSIPIASNFTAEEQAGGTGASDSTNEVPMSIYADSTNDRVTFQSNKVAGAQHHIHFHFTYLVV